MSNENLRRADRVQDDEYYTMYSTISNTIPKFRDQFKDKVVYCNCDDPNWSNFYKYFHSNFASLGLKQLICTHYAKDCDTSYAIIYDGGADFDMDAGKIVEIHGSGDYFAGDFRSNDCIEFLKQADIVCSNPPFSIAREAYVPQIIESGKLFLIIGDLNWVSYKGIFPLIKNNKIWFADGKMGMTFRVPNSRDDTRCYIGEDGQKYQDFGNKLWFTNMDTKSRQDGFWHVNGKFDQTQAHKYYEGHENTYPQYDNYPAIDIGKLNKKGKRVGDTNMIPIDYDGLMGLPISALTRYSPNELEIVDGIGRYSVMNNEQTRKDGNYLSMVDGQALYFRIIVRNLRPIKKADDLGY